MPSFMSLGSEICNFLQQLHFIEDFVIFHGSYFLPSDFPLIWMSVFLYKVHSTLSCTVSTHKLVTLIVWKCATGKKIQVQYMLLLT